MSEATPTFIILVIAVILALLLGSIAFFVFNSNRENLNAATEKGNRMSTQMVESEWTQYEGTEITGSEVIAVIKHMKDYGTFVSVDNGNGEVNYTFTDGQSLQTEMTSTEFSEALAKAKKRGGSEYINPNTRFIGEVVRDDVTEGILGIKFVKSSTVAATP